jgi:[CysO sulfur-carrier protein]-S-L-cysteine hydrolase
LRARPAQFQAFYHEKWYFPYTVGMSRVVRITRGVWNALLIQARLDPGLECCGLLAGRGGAITTLLPARNALASATAFDIAPAELFALFQRMRQQGLDHLGIYHSHPAGENAPSQRDIAAAYYPEAAYFVVSPAPEAARPVRAFSIRDGHAEEMEIEVADE